MFFDILTVLALLNKVFRQIKTSYVLGNTMFMQVFPIQQHHRKAFTKEYTNDRLHRTEKNISSNSLTLSFTGFKLVNCRLEHCVVIILIL